MRNFFARALILICWTVGHWGLADDKYVIQVHSYDGSPEAASFSSDSWGHSFLGAVKLHREPGGKWEVAGPIKNISWYPESMQMDWQSRVPVKAANVSLARTGEEGTRGKKRQFGWSDVFEISEAMFHSLEPHVTDLLNRCRYNLIRVNGDCALNCVDAIHAWVVKNANTPPPFFSGLSHGSAASAKLVGWMLTTGTVSKVEDRIVVSVAARALQAELGVEPERLAEIKPRDDFNLIPAPHRGLIRTNNPNVHN